MATVLVSLSRGHWSPVLALANAYRRWRWARLRACVCKKCEVELRTDPQTLLILGQYRAAVFMARLQLEAALTALVREIIDEHPDWKVDMRTGRCMVPWLLKQGRISSYTANRARAMYARASRVVHGQACPPTRAKVIVRDCAEVCRQLRERQPSTVITGFAAVAGGVA